MGKLTKELLLQYALSSNAEIRKAYQKRLCEELLKKGLVSIDDIDLDFKKGLKPDDFYALLTDTVLTYCETSQIWETYFKIISSEKVYPLSAAYGVIELCRSEVTDEIKQRCYQWLRNFPAGQSESNLISSLLVDDSQNGELIKIAFEKSQRLSDGYNIMYYVDDIEPYPALLDFIEILAAKKQHSVNIYLIRFCLKRLFHALADSEYPDRKSLIPKAYQIFISLVDGLSSSEDISSEMTGDIYNLYATDRIDTKTYLALSTKFTLLADKDNNRHLSSLNNGLPKAAKETVENLPVIEKIIEKQLALMNEKEILRDLLLKLSQIAHLYREKENFTTEILPPLRRLFLKKAALLENASKPVYQCCRNAWAKMDISVFLKIARYAPEGEICDLLLFTGKGYPHLWKKVFNKIRLDELKAVTVIFHLIGFYDKDEFASLRHTIEGNIKKLLTTYSFSEVHANILTEKLQTVKALRHLQVQSRGLSSEEVNEILALLK